MTIQFEVPGKERKRLAQTIGTWLEEEVRYAGAPTFAYTVGNYTIDRNGGFTAAAGADEDCTERLLEHLYDAGFEADISAVAEPEAQEEPETDTEHLDISIPADSLTDAQLGNLESLVAAKANLLKKALGAGELPILKLRGELHFPWFTTDAAPEEAHAYLVLIEKMCEMARNAKRVTAKEKDTDNEKYAFRCFLLRLGFIGDEYKTDRKVLLKNLTGSSAFKSGAREEDGACSE